MIEFYETLNGHYLLIDIYFEYPEFEYPYTNYHLFKFAKHKKFNLILN